MDTAHTATLQEPSSTNRDTVYWDTYETRSQISSDSKGKSQDDAHSHTTMEESTPLKLRSPSVNTSIAIPESMPVVVTSARQQYREPRTTVDQHILGAQSPDLESRPAWSDDSSLDLTIRHGEIGEIGDLTTPSTQVSSDHEELVMKHHSAVALPEVEALAAAQRRWDEWPNYDGGMETPDGLSPSASPTQPLSPEEEQEILGMLASDHGTPRQHKRHGVVFSKDDTRLSSAEDLTALPSMLKATRTPSRSMPRRWSIFRKNSIANAEDERDLAGQPTAGAEDSKKRKRRMSSRASNGMAKLGSRMMRRFSSVSEIFKRKDSTQSGKLAQRDRAVSNADGYISQNDFIDALYVQPDRSASLPTSADVEEAIAIASGTSTPSTIKGPNNEEEPSLADTVSLDSIEYDLQELERCGTAATAFRTNSSAEPAEQAKPLSPPRQRQPVAAYAESQSSARRSASFAVRSSADLPSYLRPRLRHGTTGVSYAVYAKRVEEELEKAFKTGRFDEARVDARFISAINDLNLAREESRQYAASAALIEAVTAFERRKDRAFRRLLAEEHAKKLGRERRRSWRLPVSGAATKLEQVFHHVRAVPHDPNADAEMRPWRTDAVPERAVLRGERGTSPEQAGREAAEYVMRVMQGQKERRD